MLRRDEVQGGCGNILKGIQIQSAAVILMCCLIPKEHYLLKIQVKIFNNIYDLIMFYYLYIKHILCDLQR